MKVKPTGKRGRVTIEVDQRDEDLLAEASPAHESLPIRDIIVPIDFSEFSYKSLDYAVAFAALSGATITLIHTVPLNYVDTDLIALDYSEIEKEAEESAKNKLKKLIQERIGPKVKANSRVQVGRPVEEIIRAANEIGANLIIMSTHGYTGLKHAFLGSTTENVVRYAPCPVLTLREQEHDFVPSPARKGTV